MTTHIMDITNGWSISHEKGQALIGLDSSKGLNVEQGDHVIWNDTVYEVVSVIVNGVAKRLRLVVRKLAQKLTWRNGTPQLPAGVEYPDDDSYWMRD